MLVALAFIALTADSVTELPRFVPLTLNCTLPTGVPDPEVRVTVAVKVTD
jgi:hypothetical protein